MKRIFPIILFILSSFIYCSGQVTFQKNYGVFSTTINSVQQCIDGGYIFTGSKKMPWAGDQNCCLIKTNANGDTLWTRSYGGVYFDGGYSIEQTTDTGYIIAGGTSSFGVLSDDVYLIKTNASGDTLWTRTYGGFESQSAKSVCQAADGGYLIIGTNYTSQDSGAAFIIKTNTGGDIQWTKTYGRGLFDYGTWISPTNDGGYIFTGGTEITGTFYMDVYLVKIDSIGNLIWSQSYGGGYYEAGNSVEQTTDGGFIISATTLSFNPTPGGYQSAYLIKTDAVGNMLWSKTYSSPGDCNAAFANETSDGGFFISGYNSPAGINNNAFLIKTNSTGDTLWTKTYGGAGQQYIYNAKYTNDGGYILVGNSDGLGYVIKTDTMGNSGCNELNTPIVVSSPLTQVAIIATIVDTFTFVQSTPPTQVGSEGAVTTICTSVGLPAITNSNSAVIYPNPFTDELIVTTLLPNKKAEIKIYNLLGKEILSQTCTTANCKMSTSIFSPGVYFVKIISDDKLQEIRKMIKE